ncbi:MAG: DinB family protein [Cyclobacteriaceae bacterium]|nr:DinB family protein [Cyclobacteriaceae bacterium]UYN86652.1 MAG: DinB family protein [Cyclobacteriaceae bacterium]
MLDTHWKNKIDTVTEKFVERFGALTITQLNHKPDRNVWSVAQNIAHLILLNSSYFRYFDEIKKGNHVLPSGSPEQQAAESLRIIHPYTSSDRLKRAGTWTIWQPANEIFDSRILSDFSDHQSVFKNHIVGLQNFYSQSTYIKYPGETELVFRLEDCIDFLIEHENRHWIQANEVTANKS